MVKVKQTTELDPVEIPLKGCTALSDIKLMVTQSLTTGFTSQVPSAVLHELLIFFCYASGPCDEKTAHAKIENSQFEATALILEASQFLTEGAFVESLKQKEYAAALGKFKSLDTPNHASGVKVIAVVGLGAKSKLKSEYSSTISNAVATLIQDKQVKSVQIVLPEDGISYDFVKAALTNLLVSLSPHTQYSPQKAKHASQLKLAKISIADFGTIPNHELFINEVSAYTKGVYIAQELTNAPPNYCLPESLANVGIAIAEQYGFELKLYDNEALVKEKMGGILGVGKGSFHSPYLVHLIYKSGTPIKKIACVGKAITFDSGGYNVKSMATLIDKMKCDMGGSAIVIGAATAIGELKPNNCEIHFIYAAAENMISAHAYRPGDVVTTFNGTTVEITNTDAEGRMTLCDVLSYAQDVCGADVIIDFATLTGAQIVSLGYKVAALFSNENTLANELLHSAQSEGELLWHMPIVEQYADFFKSAIADLKNHHMDASAGTIAGAIFLSKFISKAKWAHIDCAGPSFDFKETKATGYGVCTLVKYLLTNFS